MYLLKEDGGKLLLETGDKLVLKRTVVNPAVGIQAHTARLFIDSEEGGFNGTTTVSLGAGITVGTITVTSATKLIVDITIASGATLAYRDLTITTGANTEITVNAFRVAAEGATVTKRSAFQYTLLTRGDDIRRSPGVSIHDVLNNTPNTCAFTVDGGSNAPTIGEKIEIHDSFDDNRMLFAGTVQTVEQIYEGQTNQLAWRVQCIDFTWLFNRRRPFGNYSLTSVSDVVKDLVSKYAPGFTTNHVQTNLAKVTVTLDGSQDFVTVMTALANAIGGGHWYIDYDQDVHFFHVVPPGLELPPSDFPDLSHHVTLSETAASASTFGFQSGYYFLRHTFLYSDGSESQFGGISNFLLASGARRLKVSNIPVGVNLGSRTCVGRRLYYNRFLPYTYPPTTTPIEDILPYVQINDNTTTEFSSDFSFHSPDVATVTDITSGIPNHDAPASAPSVVLGALWSQSPIPSSHSPYNFYPFVFRYTYIFDDGSESLPSPSTTFQDADSTHGWTATITTGPGNVVKRRLYLSVAGQGERFVVINDNSTTVISNTTNGVNGGAPTLYTNVAWTLGGNFNGDPNTYGLGNPPTSATALPAKTFNGHPAGPGSALTPQEIRITGDGYWNGGWFQFKVAYVYRDGSVSFPSPASVSAGINQNIRCVGLLGWNLSNIPIGPDVNGNDVVARFIYYDMGDLTDPNYSISWSGTGPACGFVWPIGSKEADWTSPGGAIIIVPDNVTTALSNISLASLGTSNLGMTGTLCGIGNKPYNNGAILSTDPIPIWPNPDGPSLEDVDPPADIDDANQYLLHEDSGSQPFTVTTDLSQVRNRVYVVGSGSTVTTTAEAGVSSLKIADISSFSPSGGKIKIEDPATGTHQILDYSGIDGVVGNASVVLSTTLPKRVVQGSNVNNFFQADDFDSQKFLAKAELDKDGNPTDGIHEFTIVDNSLKARWQLFMRAYAELELFSKPVVQIKYATRDPKSKSGQSVHVDLSNPPCQGDFLIQDVAIDQIRDESDDLAPRYTVTASSTKFELNDLLLQILGGKLGGGSSSGAGLVVSAVATTGTSGTTGIKPRESWMQVGRSDANTPNILTFGCTHTPAGTISYDETETIAVYPGTGQFSSNHGQDSRWATFATSTVTNNIAKTQMTSPFGYLEDAVDIWWEMITSKSLSGVGLHVGFWNSIPTLQFGTNIAGISASFFAGTDAGWTMRMQTETNGGARSLAVPMGIGIAGGTYYVIRMQSFGTTSADLRVTFTINGQSFSRTWAQCQTGSPAQQAMPISEGVVSNGSSTLVPFISVNNLTGVTVKKFLFSRMYITSSRT